MLYLARKQGESIIINDNIVVKVIDIKKNYVKLGFDFPPNAKVLREEIYMQVKEENLCAGEDSAAVIKEMMEGDIHEK